MLHYDYRVPLQAGSRDVVAFVEFGPVISRVVSLVVWQIALATIQRRGASLLLAQAEPQADSYSFKKFTRRASACQGSGGGIKSGSSIREVIQEGSRLASRQSGSLHDRSGLPSELATLPRFAAP